MEDKEKQELEEKRETRRQGDVAAGISTGVGAATGVVGGSLIAGKVNAAGMENEEADAACDGAARVEGTEPSGAAAAQSAAAEKPATAVQTADDAAAPATEMSESAGVQSVAPDIQVLDCGTMYDDQGNPAEVAVLSVDGHQAAVIDIDMDGEADVIAVDINDNMILDEGEAAYVSDEHIVMSPLQHAAEAGSALNDMSEDMAQDDCPDYTNDANVDVFMA